MIIDDVVPVTKDVRPEVNLPFVRELPVLGITTRFETNSRDVHAIVWETFGMWAGLRDETDTPRQAMATVRVVVCDGTEGTVGRSPIRHTCPDALRVIAQSAGSVGISDPERAEAVAHVTGELVADRDHFRDEMLQSITLALLSSYDRHFLHAAAVACGGRAILLAGASGVGKSTLSYLAHRSGLQVMSEDRVWIQQSPRLRVWGWPSRVHLRHEALAHFPEIDAVMRDTHGAGKQRHVVDVRESAAALPRLYADDAVVCLLSRGDDAPLLTPVDRDVVVDALSRDVAPGFDRHAERHLPSVRAIAAQGGWRLRLSRDPHEALPLLEQMLGGNGLD